MENDHIKTFKKNSRLKYACVYLRSGRYAPDEKLPTGFNHKIIVKHKTEIESLNDKSKYHLGINIPYIYGTSCFILIEF